MLKMDLIADSVVRRSLCSAASAGDKLVTVAERDPARRGKSR
jgi:hypothetical protein